MHLSEHIQHKFLVLMDFTQTNSPPIYEEIMRPSTPQSRDIPQNSRIGSLINESTQFMRNVDSAPILTRLEPSKHLAIYAKNSYFDGLTDEERVIYLRGVEDVVRIEPNSIGNMIKRGKLPYFEHSPMEITAVYINCSFDQGWHFFRILTTKLQERWNDHNYQIMVIWDKDEVLAHVTNVTICDAMIIRRNGNVENVKLELLYRYASTVIFCITF